MFLKRSIVLAGGVLLFIFAFIIYFDVVHSQMETRFREERAKFGIQNTIPMASDDGTSTTPAASAPVTPSAPSSADNPASSPAIAPDTNILIGPVPPPSSSLQDATPATSPSTPDSNAAPVTPPSSTMNWERRSPFMLLAAYHPSDGMRIQMTTFQPSPTITPTPSTPPSASPTTNSPITSSTNTPSSPATNAAEAMKTKPENPPLSNSPATNSPLAGTNAAPFASPNSEAGTPRPVPVEASVIVLGYHQFVGPGQSSKNIYVMRQDVFEQEMKYLKDNGYHVVPLSDVVRFIKHEIGLPPNSVAITIDDGYKSAIVWAAPVLKKYGYPWTYFVYPQFITVNEGSGAASWNDLLALQADGVDIECHSMTHPQLTKKGSKTPEQYDAWLTNETAGAKALLEQKLGKPVPYFAYPYGAYNKQVEDKVIAAGFEAIFTVADNPVHTTTNIDSIGRYIITQPVEKNFTAYLRQGALGIADAEPAPGATITEPRPVITAILGYAGNLDPNSIETEVRDFGIVRHDFDPKTSTVRLYLPRDLIQPVVIVNIRVKDAETGQVMVANWHFNYEPGGAATNSAAAHPPIGATNSVTASTNISKPKPMAPATSHPAATTAPSTKSASTKGGTSASIP